MEVSVATYRSLGRPIFLAARTEGARVSQGPVLRRASGDGVEGLCQHAYSALAVLHHARDHKGRGVVQQGGCGARTPLAAALHPPAPSLG